MSRDIAPTGFRLPPHLKDWLKAQADKNLRSMNSELVAMLQAARQQQATTRKNRRAKVQP